MILLTGSTGFIGSHIRTALTGSPVRSGVRTGAGFPIELTRPSTLAAACDGVDAVVHAASYIGPDEEMCDAINRRGTEALVRAAGGRRFVYLSTASVYGNGPHRDAAEGSLTPAPVSALSRSRLAAEEAVLAAGGVVVRPHLVHGKGDRWFAPAVRHLVRTLGGWPGDGSALISTIAASELGSLMGALARTDLRGPLVLHANHPQPQPAREIARTVARMFGDPIPDGAGRGTGVPQRHLTMMTEDHWYRSDRIWQLTGVEPGPACTV
ncbi:MAG: hypothetical protein QOF58_8009 [Pseudonocardiales bacterium]|jgi:nucleoside-diphosphate-sugar epimerase|nr:hypothetical protein [Pseudonocardiales bacterium]